MDNHTDKPIRVRIVKCDTPNVLWYSKEIGNEFDVVESKSYPEYWACKKDGAAILKSDCEIISTPTDKCPICGKDKLISATISDGNLCTCTPTDKKNISLYYEKDFSDEQSKKQYEENITKLVDQIKPIIMTGQSNASGNPISLPTDKKTTAVMTEEDYIEQYLPSYVELNPEELETATRMLKDYHKDRLTELLSKAGDQLPGVKQYEDWYDDFFDTYKLYPEPCECYAWMKEKASAIIAGKEQQHKQEIQEKEREIERLRKELEKAKNGFQDTEADGLVFCGKCGKLNSL